MDADLGTEGLKDEGTNRWRKKVDISDEWCVQVVSTAKSRSSRVKC
jgi:hypothetical protein